MTRQDLYDLVWSAPMKAVAEKIGLSDKTVAKRCETHGVPTPPRGYWTQAATSREAPRPPLEGDPEERISIRPVRSTHRAEKLRQENVAGLVDTSLVGPTAPTDQDLDVPPDIDAPLLQALASQMQAQVELFALLARIEVRALALPPKEARFILSWVAKTRAGAERLDPVNQILNVLAVHSA